MGSPRPPHIRQALVSYLAGTLVLVVAGTLAGAAPALANDVVANPYPGWLPQLTDSRQLANAPTVVAGVVTINGSSAPGAAVHLEAWPRKETQAALGNGDEFEMVPIAKTVTDDGGRFELRLDPTALPLDHVASKDGIVEVTLVGSSAAGLGVYNFEIVVPSSGFAIGGAVEAMADRELTDFAFALQPNEFSVLASCPNGNASQTWSLGDRRVRVGSVHSKNTNKARARFTYSRSQSSTLGVGVSATGNLGSWSASGTNSQQSSTSSTSSWYRTETKRFETDFKYTKTCRRLTSPGLPIQYDVRATSHSGGWYVTNITDPTANNCKSYGSGTHSWTSQTAQTFTTGASLSGALGINLSARTGYGTAAKLEVSVDSGKTVNLCGTDGMPGTSKPGSIVQKP